MTTALPNKLCSGHHKATKEEDDQGIPGEQICRTAGFKYSWKKMKAAAQDGTGWRKVVCAWPMLHMEATRRKSSQVSQEFVLTQYQHRRRSDRRTDGHKSYISISRISRLTRDRNSTRRMTDMQACTQRAQPCSTNYLTLYFGIYYFYQNQTINRDTCYNAFSDNDKIIQTCSDSPEAPTQWARTLY